MSIVKYACLFHPRYISETLSTVCTYCGEALSFPQDNPPTEIGVYRVEAEIARSTYAISYRVRHSLTGIVSLLRVTPRELYRVPDPLDASRGGIGDSRNFQSECKMHDNLRDISGVAKIDDWGDAEVQFGSRTLAVHWIKMEFIQGETIYSHTRSNKPLGPLSIMQIAEDLLNLSAALETRGIYHNDLHSGNAIVSFLPADRQRRDAVDPGLEVKVFDLSCVSFSDEASNEDRYGDIEQISAQILCLLDAYEEASSLKRTDDFERRLTTQLRRVAQGYRHEDLDSRRPRASHMLSAVRSAYNAAMFPTNFSAPTLTSVQEHYNAQTLPARFTKSLLWDPNGTWASRITTSGPQLIVGMRGCGKTMLLRSLEWSAQVGPGPGETELSARQRILNQDYLGLFVSCAHLINSPREHIGANSVTKLFIAYAREAVRAANLCELAEYSEVDPHALREFISYLDSVIPNIEFDARLMTLSEVETALNRQLVTQSEASRAHHISPLEAFEQLAIVTRKLIPIWRDRIVLFLLDDLSKRYVQEAHLPELLSTFSLKSEHFGFKISTETQTQMLLLPSGERALEGRDYQIFDLGEEVLRKLKGKGGATFVAEILDRRQRLIADPSGFRTVRSRLGEQSLASIADRIIASRHESGSPKDLYWGIQALAAVCIGDIGDVLQIFARMTVGKKSFEFIDRDVQHQALVRHSSIRLLSLAKIKDANSWHYKHATAFAAAAHEALVNLQDLKRQFGDIFVEVSHQNKDLFPQIMDLVDNGVYSIVGFRQRQKSETQPPFYQFALRFRKIAGLGYYIPLSNRDRFELYDQDVLDWLRSPDPDHLLLRSTAARERIFWDIDDTSEDAEGNTPPEFSSVNTDTTELKVTEQYQLSLFDDFIGSTETPVCFTPSLSKKISFKEHPFVIKVIPWDRSTLFVATGFEDRAIALLRQMRDHDVAPVKRIVLLRYTTHKYSDEIDVLAYQLALSVEVRDIDPNKDPSAVFENYHSCIDSESCIIDSSAMTKALIFTLVRKCLIDRKKVYFIHVAAETYEPSKAQLLEIVRSFSEIPAPDALEKIQQATPGEGSNYDIIEVGGAFYKPEGPRILLANVSLKFDRLLDLLINVRFEAYDRVVGILTRYEEGVMSGLDQIVESIGDLLLDSAPSDRLQVTADGAEDLLRLLDGYYQNYVIGSGYSMDFCLTGTKVHSAAIGAYAALDGLDQVFYAAPTDRDYEHYSHGIGATRMFIIERTDE